MSLIYADRVQETFTTTGTGTISLGGPVTGYQAFSAAMSNGATCYYAATDGTNWEVGLGTYASSGDTLARTTILASSNSGSAVSWAAGTKNIWLDLPANVLKNLSSVGPSRSNLRGAWVSNTTATWTAKQLVVLDAGGVPYALTSYNETLNSATSGAGGLDTGTLASSTWYYVYAIYNPLSTTANILMSLSSTAPTLPSGYTASALIGAVLTDSSSHFIGFTQANEKWRYQVGNNLSNYPSVASNYSGQLGVTGFCPYAITSNLWVGAFGYASTYIGVNVFANLAAYDVANSGGALVGGAGQNGIVNGSVIPVLLESSSIWVASALNTYIMCYGFDINF